ncbi:Na+/H+ exchanger family and Cation/H+ exchanger domain-containing protein [Strongyloides ratti]|uniref:Sodium/hydrogen exchanger n=1 Tax=Strongyloides ratti TaxID=34506 RepID=A0A090LJI7_STRRB|nr:Na+/H+ exchanger family and Cation/H+ exchanger domain-containing protein [Strongyloides ratti]CEF69873.1 Na+/H+ exchanger family and Cation/H+ exchanger domain-containing protein [Strongyloides ratti]
MNETVHEHSGGFQVFSFNWEEVKAPVIICGWLLLAGVAKIVFHLSSRYRTVIPDSASLIILGLIIGGFCKLGNVDEEQYFLDFHTFFYFLLPPIIFDAGYFMPNKFLFHNIASVGVFAIAGTILNTGAIGGFLYMLNCFNIFSIQFTFIQIFTFASLISAVDPVAVLALFEELNVNSYLYIAIFGESLFNDGVSVVLFEIFSEFDRIGASNLVASDYIKAVILFPIAIFGGFLIGIISGIIVSWVTKHSFQVKILNPVFIFIFPYLSYLGGELIGLSPILSIVACGMFMKQYVGENIGKNASTAIKYFIKMLAHICESVIYMFLGLSAFALHYYWDTWFVISTIFICFISRVIFVILQCLVINPFRKNKFTLKQQIVMFYGGLRGCICYGMIQNISSDVPAKNMFIAAVISEVFFTVFLHGITIRGVLYLLKIEPEDDTKQEWEEKNSFYGRCKRRYLDPLLKRYSSKMSFVNKNATNVSINNMNSFGQEDFNDINKTNNYNDNSKSQENNKNKLSIHNIFKRIKIGHDNNNSNVEINVSNENNFKNLNIEEALEKTEKIVETYIEDQNTIREISVKLIKMLDENKLLSENNPESDIEDDSLSSMKKRTSH